MDLAQTIKVNKKIITLIRSKHAEVFPPVYATPESRYYERLQTETEQAQRFLTVPPVQ